MMIEIGPLLDFSGVQTKPLTDSVPAFPEKTRLAADRVTWSRFIVADNNGSTNTSYRKEFGRKID
jgi:hypothetical protein